MRFLTGLFRCFSAFSRALPLILPMLPWIIGGLAVLFGGVYGCKKIKKYGIHKELVKKLDKKKEEAVKKIKAHKEVVRDREDKNESYYQKHKEEKKHIIKVYEREKENRKDIPVEEDIDPEFKKRRDRRLKQLFKNMEGF